MTLDAGVWVNGDWYAPDAARVSTADRGFLLGDGCFETLRYASGVIEGVDQHLGMLARSADVLGFALPFSPQDLVRALDELTEELGRLCDGEAAVRITASRGAGGRGADAGEALPTVVIQASNIPSRDGLAALNLCTVDIRRNETSPLSQIKSLSYGDNLAARRAAVAGGFDEALMLNTRGRPACLAMANLFVLHEKDRLMATPTMGEGARPGYMRGMVLDQARGLGWTVSERAIEASELQEPGVACLATNSLWGVRQVASLDGRVLPRISLEIS